jgi:hypothetical protein
MQHILYQDCCTARSIARRWNFILELGTLLSPRWHALDERKDRLRTRTMPPRRSKDAGWMKRRWRVVLLRAKGEILGTVEASDVASAKAAAAIQFDLDEIQRNRDHGAGAGLRVAPRGK